MIEGPRGGGWGVRVGGVLIDERVKAGLGLVYVTVPPNRLQIPLR